MVDDILKHERYLIKVALSFTGNMDDAKDLVQDTYEYALIGNYRYEKNIKNWLFTILKNKYINEWRKEKRKENSGYIPDNILYNTCYCDILKKDILNDIRKLPLLQKRSILLRYKGYKYNEIGEKLNLNINTIKSLIFRTRKNLKSWQENIHHHQT